MPSEYNLHIDNRQVNFVQSDSADANIVNQAWTEVHNARMAARDATSQLRSFETQASAQVELERHLHAAEVSHLRSRLAELEGRAPLGQAASPPMQAAFPKSAEAPGGNFLIGTPMSISPVASTFSTVLTAPDPPSALAQTVFDNSTLETPSRPSPVRAVDSGFPSASPATNAGSPEVSLPRRPTFLDDFCLCPKCGVVVSTASVFCNMCGVQIPKNHTSAPASRSDQPLVADAPGVAAGSYPGDPALGAGLSGALPARQLSGDGLEPPTSGLVGTTPPGHTTEAPAGLGYPERFPVVPPFPFSVGHPGFGGLQTPTTGYNLPFPYGVWGIGLGQYGFQPSPQANAAPSTAAAACPARDGLEPLGALAGLCPPEASRSKSGVGLEPPTSGVGPEPPTRSSHSGLDPLGAQKVLGPSEAEKNKAIAGQSNTAKATAHFSFSQFLQGDMLHSVAAPGGGDGGGDDDSSSSASGGPNDNDQGPIGGSPFGNLNPSSSSGLRPLSGNGPGGAGGSGPPPPPPPGGTHSSFYVSSGSPNPMPDSEVVIEKDAYNRKYLSTLTLPDLPRSATENKSWDLAASSRFSAIDTSNNDVLIRWFIAATDISCDANEAVLRFHHNSNGLPVLDRHVGMLMASTASLSNKMFGPQFASYVQWLSLIHI